MDSHEGVGAGQKIHFHLLHDELNAYNKEAGASNPRPDSLALVAMNTRESTQGESSSRAFLPKTSWCCRWRDLS